MSGEHEPITSSTGGSSALPGVRLRPTASRRGGPASILGWIGAGAVAVSAGWLVYVAVRPLPESDIAEAAQVPPRVVVPERAATVGERERLLAKLTEGNAFAFKRKAWSGGTPVAADPTAPATDPSVPVAGEAKVTAEQTVPPDIKPAFDNLRLVGLFESVGKPAMMISFVQGDDPAKSYVFRVNEEIADKAHPGAAWKVLAINLEQKSAVLSRAGHSVELRMFKNVPAPVVAAKPGVPAPVPEPTLVRQTRAEIIAKLREAKISEADVAAMIAELGPDPDAPPTGEATAKAIEQALAPKAGENGAASGAPAGLEEVLKMMAKRPGAPGATTSPAAPVNPPAASNTPGTAPANPPK